MRQKLVWIIALAVVVPAIALGAVSSGVQARKTDTRYPGMAPLDRYLIGGRNAEIALARSAAPRSIADHAEVLVLGRHGYDLAVKGTNGFVCLVERSWSAQKGDPDFWNPKLRGPICLNAAATRSYLPITIYKTKLALAGKSEAQIFASVNAAFDKKELPAMEPGAMSYMMSKQGYLAGAEGHWHPHLMFFVSLTGAMAWGAGQPGSPILASADPEDRLTVFMIPLPQWSDGTPDSR